MRVMRWVAEKRDTSANRWTPRAIAYPSLPHVHLPLHCRSSLWPLSPPLPQLDMETLPALPHEQVVEALRVVGSHPRWMVERWVRRIGIDDTAELMEANNERPIYCVRASASKGMTGAALLRALGDMPGEGEE